MKSMVKLNLGGNMMLRVEDSKWVNYIGVYFFILEDVNEKLLELIRYSNNDIENIELYFFDIAVNLNRLIPMKSKKLINDGILKLKKHFDFLDQDYKNLFKNYKEELIKINDVRNKFEHCPHQIKWKTYIGNNREKTIVFNNEEYLMDIIEGNQDKLKYRKNKKEFLEWKIETNNFINIIVEINKIYLKIQNQLRTFTSGNTEMINHPYIKRLLNIKFYINANDFK